jgi:hypothetical protein
MSESASAQNETLDVATNEPSISMSDLKVTDDFSFLTQNSFRLAVSKAQESTATRLKVYFSEQDEAKLLIDQVLTESAVVLEGLYPARTELLVALWFDEANALSGRQEWQLLTQNSMELELNL